VIGSDTSMTSGFSIIGACSIAGAGSVTGCTITDIVGIGVIVATAAAAAWAAMTYLPMRSRYILYHALANRYMVAMFAIQILASSFILANATLLDSLTTLSIMDWASN
jgi:hypothetical protein